MTVTELIAAAQKQLLDDAGPVSAHLVSDEEWYRFANSARDRMFYKVRTMIIDSTTPDVCGMNIVGGTAQYPLHESIIEVKSIQLANQHFPLVMITVEELKQRLPDWRTRAAGIPLYWCPDLDTGMVTLIPSPAADTTAYLTVSRLPLTEMARDNDVIEVRREYQEDLITWMLYRALSKKDPELDKPTLAETYKQKFDLRCGEIRVEQEQRFLKRSIRPSSMVI